MTKIHVILPQGCDLARDTTLESALAALASAAEPYGGVAVHQSDEDYEHAKNPLWGREAKIYNPSPTGTEAESVIQAIEDKVSQLHPVRIGSPTLVPRSLESRASGWKS